MRFTFSPALGETVTIGTPPLHTSGLQLGFTAILNSQDYREFQQAGARLQLWSEISSSREWAELDFEPADSASLPPKNTLSLVPSDEDDENIQPTLTLNIPVPYPQQGTSRFSFTYRLVYPDGNIEWLGSYGNNGILVIDQNSSNITFEEGWHTSEGSLTWNTRGKSVENFKVAQVLDPVNWKVWAVGDSFSCEPKDCSLLVFAAKTRPSILFTQTFFCFTSPKVSVSFSIDGDLTVSGDGSIFLRAYDSHSTTIDAFSSGLLRGYSHQPLRLVGPFDDHLLLVSRDKLPIKIIALRITPLSLKRSPSILSIKQSRLLELFEGSVDAFSVFAPTNSKILFSLDEADHDLVFHFPSSGGLFLLSPRYTLRSGPHRVEISILSSLLPPAQIPEATLPTPPPSPHLRPIAHLSGLNPSQRNSSDLSISDIGIPSRRDTPEPFISESSSMLTVRPTGVAPIPRRSSSLISLRSQSSNGGGPISRFMKYIFFSLAIFLISIIRKIFGLKGSKNTRNEAEVVVDERTPLLAQTEPPPAVEVLVDHPQIAPPRSALFIDVTEGSVSFVCKYPNTSSRPRLLVDFNGVVVDNKMVTQLQDGVDLVQFEAGKPGGKLKIDII